MVNGFSAGAVFVVLSMGQFSQAATACLARIDTTKVRIALEEQLLSYQDIPSTDLCNQPSVGPTARLICANEKLRLMDLLARRSSVYAIENATQSLADRSESDENHAAFLESTGCDNEECVCAALTRSTDDALGGWSPYSRLTAPISSIAAETESRDTIQEGGPAQAQTAPDSAVGNTEMEPVAHSNGGAVLLIALATGLIALSGWWLFRLRSTAKDEISRTATPTQNEELPQTFLGAVFPKTPEVSVGELSNAFPAAQRSNEHSSKAASQNTMSMENDGTVACPYCAEQIKASAKKCRYCSEWLTADGEQSGLSGNNAPVVSASDTTSKNNGMWGWQLGFTFFFLLIFYVWGGSCFGGSPSSSSSSSANGEGTLSASCGSAMRCMNAADAIFESRDITRIPIEDWKRMEPMYRAACKGNIVGACDKADLAAQMQKSF